MKRLERYYKSTISAIFLEILFASYILSHALQVFD